MSRTDLDLPNRLGHRVLAGARKLEAVLLLAVIAQMPVTIVAWKSTRGGLRVAGYVAGVIVIPLVAVGALRAVLKLTGDLEGLIEFVYDGLTILISLAACLWSFLR